MWFNNNLTILNTTLRFLNVIQIRFLWIDALENHQGGCKGVSCTLRNSKSNIRPINKSTDKTIIKFYLNR